MLIIRRYMNPIDIGTLKSIYLVKIAETYGNFQTNKYTKLEISI